MKNELSCEQGMVLYSYIVTHDTGFAPNPYGKYCTLACCKPRIRSTAKEGDWIIGLSKKSEGYKIIYLMKVREKLSFDQYFNDHRFRTKKPKINKEGDNIYKPIGQGKYHQLCSRHSNRDGSEDIAKKKRDLSGRYVLISDHFIYFGNQMKSLPRNLRFLIVGRGHKNRFLEDQKRIFRKFVGKLSKWGRIGSPSAYGGRNTMHPKRRCT